MNFSEYRTLFRAGTLALILIVSLAFFTSVFPIPKTGEKFFALALLGSEEMAEKYFPNDNSTILLNEEVDWYVVVYNYVPAVQYVSVLVKLINSTISSPDSVNCTPAPDSYEIMNFSVFLTYEKSATARFVWKVADIVLHDDLVKINSVSINGVVVPSRISAVNGTNFRFVFELWWFNVTSNRFEFAWDSGLGLRCAWAQLVFNVATD